MARNHKHRIEQIESALMGDKTRKFFVWVGGGDDETKIRDAMATNRCSREQVVTVSWKFDDVDAGDDLIAVRYR